MKQLIFVLALFVIVASCNKENMAPMMAEPEPPIDTTITTVKYMGEFVKGPYGTTSGNVKIVERNGRRYLRLDSFKVSSGPDLKVYVSREIQPINFIKLGNLKGLTGDQEYDLPANANLDDYRYALIHCEQYNHLFGSALLVKN
ncbi:MAG: DM13 domain-containing protein [Chitinophagaceae bacterium]|nr:DM13 domain-containing protein [Chitinophagaceae bacterium]